ncbi:Transcriptional regulator, LysR family protein [Sandaracinus amylolyticus]|uniref:Transcriptional regulator, LysR family protein n=1 Tax=Sandaracinus amylolyticus TaxID=927083 RepID=A0A0F6W6J8_9BACT|nr:Transcriptional regulator, LysR family protein [Sandaracinus amylolyticus]
MDQWAMFVAVCERGSVHAAARALGRSHSALSHALGVLQDAVGQPLVALEGRRLVPTEAGAIVAHRARALLEDAHSLEALAQTIALGWEAELRVAIDGVVPRAWVARALEAMQSVSRSTRVRVEHQLRTGAEHAARDTSVDVAVTTVLPDGADPDPIGIVRFAPVVGAAHPLASRRPKRGEVERMLQIVLADTGPAPERAPRGWLRGQRRWTVPDVGTAKALLAGGRAFAILPRDDVADELARGALSRLAPAARDFAVQAHVVLPKRERSGPAARALADALRASATSE